MNIVIDGEKLERLLNELETLSKEYNERFNISPYPYNKKQ